MNRCVVLTVNESREQTQLIHELQRERETLEGLLADEDRKHIISVHQNAQRLLKPLKVVNPFAKQLTFMDSQTRSRRDHMKYLRLIKTVALLHQYQREIKTVNHQGNTLEYIEVALSDIAVANQLAHEVLGRSLDELPPQTRKLLTLIYDMVQALCQQQKCAQKDCQFSRRDIRDYTGWSDNQLKVHCKRLEELEYLLVHRGSRGKLFAYELAFDGDSESDKPFLMGLIDVESLGKHQYDVEKLGLNPNKLGPSCPQVGAKLGSSWSDQNAKKPVNRAPNEIGSAINGKTHNKLKNIHSSHRSDTAVAGVR